MKLFAIALLFAFCIGCQEAGSKLDESAEQVESGAKKAGKQIEAASLTPRIKAAIIGNPILNDPGNEINVDSIPGHIHITGYVKSAEMKAEAEQMARQVLKEHKSTEMLHNDLVIRK